MRLATKQLAASDHEEQARRPTPRERFLVRLAVSVFAWIVLSVVLYLASVHGATPNSDGATVVLEGQSMLAGHVTLSGWALSLDSFWTVDVLFYALGVAIFGAHGILLHLVPAAIAALVIVVGSLIASDGEHGRGSVAAVVTLWCLLALPSVAFSSYFLLGPLHVGTALFCLVAFYGLRHGRFDRGFLLATAFIALGLLGDAQMLTLGVAPLLVAGIAAGLRTRRVAMAAPAFCAALLGTSLALIVRAVAEAIGTFSINEVAPTASVSEMVHNLTYVARYVPALFGLTRGPFGPTGVPAALEAVHVLSLLAVVGGILVAAYGLVRGLVKMERNERFEAFYLDDVLLIAVLCGIVTFLKLDGNESLTSARYLSAAIIFSSVLGARVAARAIAALERRGAIRAVLPLVLVVTCYCASFGLSFRLPSPTSPGERLVLFLRSHHLREGIGDYWTSSILTVLSNGEVVVRPVIDSPELKVVRYERNSTSQWYANTRFSFLVYDRALPLVDEQEAISTFGRPSHVYDVGIYQVLTWHHLVSVSVAGVGA